MLAPTHSAFHPRPRAGIYARISDDKYMGEEDEGKGIQRQLDDGRRLATLKEWEVVKLYIDNDLSAYKTNVYRPDFEAMLRDLAAGVIDGIIVADLDRFARQPRDLERAIELYDKGAQAGRHLVFASVTGDVDLSSDMGITMARVMVAFANKASRDTARRVARKHRQMADEGARAGGHRAFGWGLPLGDDQRGKPAFDHSLLHPDESRLLLEAIDDITGGVTESEIARRWNEAGVTTPQGRKWTRKHVRSVLMSPRIAGWRTFKGGIAIHTGTGEPVVGYQEALVSNERWEALRSLLVGRGGKQAGKAHGGGRTSAKYLLAGLLVCGFCMGEGRRMTLSGNASKRSVGGWNYACTSAYGCGKVSITGLATDEAVTRLVFARARDLRARPLDSAPWDKEDELAALKADLGDLLRQLRERRVKAATVLPVMEEWQELIEKLEAEKADYLGTRSVLATQAVDLESAWTATEDVGRRRALLRRYLAAVVISQSSGGRAARGQIDLRRLEPVWGQASAAPTV